MSFLRTLCAITITGISGCVYKTIQSNWQNKFTVKANISDNDGDDNVEDVNGNNSDGNGEHALPPAEYELVNLGDLLRELSSQLRNNRIPRLHELFATDNIEADAENIHIWESFEQDLLHVVPDLPVHDPNQIIESDNGNNIWNEEGNGFGDEDNIYLLEGQEFNEAVENLICHEQLESSSESAGISPLEHSIDNAEVTMGGAQQDPLYLDYGDFVVSYNREKKLVNWTTEKICKENLARAEHRHCEFLRIESRIPDGLSVDQLIDGNDNEYDVAYLPSSKDDKEPEYEGACGGCNVVEDCVYCKQSTLWNAFYQYYKFLLEKCNYKYIKVCSGAICLSEPTDTAHCPVVGEVIVAPTHFFKVILCEQQDGSYRLECYKFKIGNYNIPRPDLKNFLLQRQVLEEESGLMIFRQIEPHNITDKATHPQFAAQ